MLKALMLATALAICTFAPVQADHYVPEPEAAIRVNFFCDTVADLQAFILEGQPNPIPDEVACWSAAVPIMGIFKEKAGEVRAENDELFEIHRVDNLFYINEFGFLEPWTVEKEVDGQTIYVAKEIYLAIVRHDGNA